MRSGFLTRGRLLGAGPLLAGLVLLCGADHRGRDLTFEDRVEAQRAIERVYYARQIGATRAFEVAVPREVLEKKVRTYLKESLALEKLWHTRVTGEALRRELERIARQTRSPEVLRELYAALGNDVFLVQECLARPALVARLTRNFFAGDSRIHAATREQAEDLREHLARGEISPRTEAPQRIVLEVVRLDEASAEARSGQAHPVPARNRPSERVSLQPDEFARWRRTMPTHVGGIGRLVEERHAYGFRVLLAEEAGRVQVATYRFEKIGWDVWWGGVGDTFDERDVRPVASFSGGLPRSGTGPELEPTGSTCRADDTWDNGTLDDAPDALADHAAVWTGRVMVVLGRSEGSLGELRGRRYDPVIDTWQSVSMAGAPPAWLSGTAVWTGAEVVVWGTRTLCDPGGCRQVGAGGRYDPIADRWLPMATTDAPPPGGDHTALWTGRLMVVWGGAVCGPGGCSQATNIGGRYDPIADTWEPTSTTGAPSARVSHSAVWTGSRMIVWGGSGGSTGGLYDPVSDSWLPTSTTNAPLGSTTAHSAIWTGREMLIWGIREPDTEQTSGARYDPSADAWSPLSTTDAPIQGRSRFEAVWTGSEMVVWGGGECDDSGSGTAGGRYDPVMDTWRPVSTVNAAGGRCAFSAVWTDDAMIVWGGTGHNGHVDLFNSGGRYDPVTDTWTPTSTTTAPFDSTLNTGLWTGHQMLVWGIYDSNGGRYDPVLDSWSPISTLNAPSGFYGFRAVWSGDRMLVWGGGDGRRGGRYDPVADTWAPISPIGAPQGSADTPLVWAGTAMLLWNGTEGGRYDPVADTWSPISPANAPPAAQGATAIWTGTFMILWGGSYCDAGGCFPSKSARYDPVSDTWSPTATTNAPAPRDGHTAVWTGEVMVVWGGRLNTGGRYDPASDTWSPTATTNAPSARTDHTAVWADGLMLVWGGEGPFNDGGRYDPVNDAWAPVSTADAPSPRFGHTAVWTGDVMIIWSGNGSFDSLDTALPPLRTGGRYVVNLSPDADRDGFTLCAGDCDDTDPRIHPEAAEACNGIDDDCDAFVDEAPEMTCTASSSVLNMQSSGRSFSLTTTLRDRCSGRSLDPGALGPLHVAALATPALGQVILPVPDYGPGCTQDGIWETLAGREMLTGGAMVINFITPSDGNCATLDGNRQDIIALLHDAANGETVRIDFAGVHPADPDPVGCSIQTTLQKRRARRYVGAGL